MGIWLTQFLCLLLFHLQFQAICSVSKLVCHHEQRHALLQFKKHFSIDISASYGNPEYNIPPYPKTDSWKEGSDCCLWDGITCDLKTGYVIGIDLSNSMLHGTFYSNNSVFFLSHLQNLNLFNNDFNSSLIPSQFSQLLRLTHLNLSQSNFAGRVPSEISHLSSLVSLDLSWNYRLTIETSTFNKLAQDLTKLRELNLKGVNMSLVAPNSMINLSSSLSSLKLSDCYGLLVKFLENIHSSNLLSLDFSGNNDLILDTIVFNKLVQNLPNLREVDLSFLNMSLVSPNVLTNLSYSLSSLKLANCGLRGEFPGDILQRPHLRYLDLQGNEDLTSIFPKSNWSTFLYALDVSETKIPIYLEPNFITNLRSLKILDLSNCSFISSNLALFGNLTHLTRLDLSYNNFSGQIIPSSLGNLEQLTSLSVSSSNLSGQIPSSLGNLKKLIHLDLSNNNLSSPIPNSLANLAQLQYLRLSNNQLIGPIPSQLGRLLSLAELYLYGNFLNATIPSSLFTLPRLQYLLLQNNLLLSFDYTGDQFQNNSLYYIDLSNNKLHGPIPSSIFNLMGLGVLILSSNNKLNGQLSSSVCKLQSLEILDLSNNSLSGIIPQCLGNFSNSLSVLHFGGNNFHGTLPSTFSKGNSLRYLNLNGNQLQGKISPSIINCTNLEILDLGNNQVNDTFPYFIENLPQLQILVLHSNKLYGSIRSSNSHYSFPKLRMFDLSNNNFTGPLPTKYFDNFQAMIKVDQYMGYMGEIGMFSYDYSVELTLKGFEIELARIQTILTTIDLSSNKFTGKIPQSIGKLKSLKLLNLSHNSLTGKIQPSIKNLTSLETLDLSSNLLTGRIPTQLVELTFLQVFRVSYNQLEGPIPEGKQFNTFDSSSYEGNSRLCGFALKKACNNGEREQVKTPPKEDDSNSKNGFGWESVFTGYASGVVFGLLTGYLVFRIRKPEWFVRMVESEGYHLRAKWLNNSNNTSRSLRRRRRRN